MAATSSVLNFLGSVSRKNRGREENEIYQRGHLILTDYNLLQLNYFSSPNLRPCKNESACLKKHAGIDTCAALNMILLKL